MSDTQDLDVLQGRLGALKRHYPEQKHSDLEAQIAALRITRFVQRTLADAPPLTAQQRADIARALRGGRQ